MLNILFFVHLLALVLGGTDSLYSAPPDVSNHRNLELLPKSCGNATISSRILHGEKAGILEFPWMALLGSNGSFKCGGTIINERYILTAAHCLPRTDLVRVGEYNLKTKKDCQKTKKGVVCAPPFQDLEVEKVIPHENYDPYSLENDIGLVRVSRIDLTKENSKPVCLPLAESRTYNFDRAIVTGWGVTEKKVTSPELLKVSVPYVPLDICQEIWRNVSSEICNKPVLLDLCKQLSVIAKHINHRQVCAGGIVKESSCHGDSGGPLLVNGTINGHKAVVQQGIVSGGDPYCGPLHLPALYSKVAMFMDWILDNLEP